MPSGPDPSVPLVLTRSVRVPAGDGPPMGGYLARPAGIPDAPGVIVGMELFGVSAHVRDVCDRLASLGYAALAPDLYHRTDPGVELPADDEGRARGFELLHRMDRDEVVADLRAAAGALAARGHALRGAVGLSVGGHLVYLAATRLPVPVTVVVYGGWLTTSDLPLSRPHPTVDATPGITGRVLVLVGEHDPVVPPEQRTALGAALSAAGVEHEVAVEPGAGHGFLCERRASFHAEAAARSWDRIAAVLGEDRAQSGSSSTASMRLT